ncbi:MAG: hypothetical protein V8S98_05395 [Lachnospiraceae bacterium]
MQSLAYLKNFWLKKIHRWLRQNLLLMVPYVNDFSFSNQYSAMVSAAGRDFGMSMYPTTADATQQPIYLKPSQFFSVAQTSQYKAEAAKLVNWITNPVEN